MVGMAWVIERRRERISHNAGDGVILITVLSERLVGDVDGSINDWTVEGG